jgi:thioredoxin 1
MKLNKLLILISVFGLLNSVNADPIDYRKQDFQKAQMEGKIIVLDVGAWWCPVCNLQKSRLTSLITDENDFKDIIVFLISNSDEETKKEYSVNSRGTLILFNGKQELDRLVLDADKTKIRNLLSKGIIK